MHWTIESVQWDNFRDRIQEKVVRGVARIHYITLSGVSRIISQAVLVIKINTFNLLKVNCSIENSFSTIFWLQLHTLVKILELHSNSYAFATDFSRQAELFVWKQYPLEWQNWFSRISPFAFHLRWRSIHGNRARANEISMSVR